MLNRIKALLRAVDDGARPGVAEPDGHQLAAAALMVEAAMMDGQLDAAERETIDALLRRQFGLNEAEADSLFEAAAARQRDSHQLIRFTRAVVDHYDHEERVQLIEWLWEVVYADGELHHYEANLLRRVAGLIYVTDRERGAARKRVLARLGMSAS